MYEAWFDLERAPFSIAPDPHFLYMSERHREALAHLLWGLSSDGGFVLLTGEVGTGKTTLSRCLLEQIPEDTDLAFVVNPRVTVTELLATICDELGVDVAPAERDSVKSLVDHINARLLAAHGASRRVVLVIDEAQNLAIDVLEQIRLLTNLETNERKLLQIILIGQPELVELLRRPELRQLSQRITARYHLDPLDEDELAALVQHRLTVAGSRRNPFAADAMRALHRFSGGIPRVANVIADRALMGAFAEERERIGADVVRRAAAEVLGDGPAPRSRLDGRLLAAAALGGLVVGLAVYLLLDRTPAPPVPVAGSQAPALGSTSASAAPAPASPAPQSPAPETAPSRGPPTASPPADPTPTPSQPTPPQATPSKATPSQPARSQPATDPSPVATDRGAFAELWATPAEASRRAAFEGVLEAWFTPMSLASASSAAPCARVLDVGLRCLDHEGNWPALRELDRPAVLELWRDDGTGPRYAALVAADADGGLLRTAAGDRRIDRAGLDAHWRGRATVLWQMPPDYRTPLSLGDRGAAVAWLRQKLDEADGVAAGVAEADAPAAARRFDAGLESRLRAFQRGEGLVDDGIAGPQTWMRINARTAAAVPRLPEPDG